MYPSLAVAERLGDAVEPRFFCSLKAVDGRVLEPTGYRYTRLSVRGLGGNPLGWPGFLYRFKSSQWVARQELREAGARCVVAMGGYVSGPVVYAARGLGVGVLLVNLDATAGRANRRLAPMADRVLSVYDEPGLGVAYEKIGFPIRDAARATERREAGEGGKPTLLVTGASSGAKTINEAMMELAERGELGEWKVIHLTGMGRAEDVRRVYGERGVEAEVHEYVDGMGELWGRADAAVSRAGAGSVAEAVANGVPTVFVPYPYHKDAHQRLNVERYERAGAAVCLTDAIDRRENADRLGRVLREMRGERAVLAGMRDKLRAFAGEDGAEAIAGAVRAVMGG